MNYNKGVVSKMSTNIVVYENNKEKNKMGNEKYWIIFSNGPMPCRPKYSECIVE